MADDKRAREKQADDAERRQRKRDVEAAVERGDEPEPPVDEAALGEVDAALSDVSFPATGEEVVAAVGDRTIESPEGTLTVADLVPATDAETFDAPGEVRERVRRPTVAETMKRIVEATDEVPDATLSGSQRDAYLKTLVALKGIDADDDDEGVAAVGDWIVERIREKGRLPGSREARKRGAKFCRSHGYQVRNDEWLGA